MDKKTLIAKYITYVLEHGKAPVSVYAFAAYAGTDEDTFYTSFSSLEALEKNIWKSFAEEAVDSLTSGKEFVAFKPTEKILTFFYTLVQVLRKNRSYVLMTKKQGLSRDTFNALSGMKHTFVAFITQIIDEAVAAGEFADRKMVVKSYPHALWAQWLFVMDYWTNDESADFELTDAAIEKSLNLTLGLMANNTLDKALDFAKFLLTKKEKATA